MKKIEGLILIFDMSCVFMFAITTISAFARVIYIQSEVYTITQAIAYDKIVVSLSAQNYGTPDNAIFVTFAVGIIMGRALWLFWLAIWQRLTSMEKPKRESN